MTQWTNEQYQELSRKVAEKFGVPARRMTGYSTDYEDEQWLYLHNDWHTIMELCVKHKVDAFIDNPKDRVVGVDREFGTDYIVEYADHNHDPSLAERVARMLALLEIEL